MKKTVKRSKLIELNNTIAALARVKNREFQHRMILNKFAIETEVKAIQELHKFPEGFQEYEKKRNELAQSLCEKDDTGNPKIKNNRYIFTPEKQLEYQAKQAELYNEYIDAIKEADVIINEINKILDSEVEIDFVAIPYEMLPDDIDGNELSSIYFITEKPEKEEVKEEVAKP